MRIIERYRSKIHNVLPVAICEWGVLNIPENQTIGWDLLIECNYSATRNPILLALNSADYSRYIKNMRCAIKGSLSVTTSAQRYNLEPKVHDDEV